MKAEVTITGIAAGGAGVGRLPGGKVTFVHRTAPGERVRVRVTEEHDRWSRAELLEVLEASPARREAPCPHYDRCGGCTLEHLRYEAQLEAKAGIVRDALERIGGLDVEVPRIDASPVELAYRNRVSFTLLRSGAGDVVAGFHELQRPERVLDIDGSCRLPEPELARAWDALRAGWGADASRLPPGEALRLTLRSTAGGLTLLVEGGAGPGDPDALLEAVPGLRAVWQRPTPGARARLLAGAERVREAWNGASIEIGGGVFLQVNRSAAALLEDHVVARALAREPATAVDAYCGVGVYSERLAAHEVAVTGIDTDADAVGEAERRVSDARFLTGRVEDALPDVLPAELAILNPPRAGLDEAVPAQLGETPPDRLIYVSCDPATLARDLERLSPAFGLAGLRCFDLFPQTAHVETVAELERR